MERSTSQRIETLARELAQLGGARILASIGALLEVEYKHVPLDPIASPVSIVDQEIELEARARIAQEFPEHAIVGEEVSEPFKAAEFTWVLDPIDGTTNFLRRYPLFASSVGVLQDGVPVAGAVWCSATPWCSSTTTPRRASSAGWVADAVSWGTWGPPDAGSSRSTVV
jgi:myo-inositol-1(or 4)-monophosphatase